MAASRMSSEKYALQPLFMDESLNSWRLSHRQIDQLMLAIYEYTQLIEKHKQAFHMERFQLKCFFVIVCVAGHVQPVIMLLEECSTKNFEKTNIGRPAKQKVANNGFSRSTATRVGGDAQWQNVDLWPANFSCRTLDLQLMGDHLWVNRPLEVSQLG